MSDDMYNSSNMRDIKFVWFWAQICLSRNLRFWEKKLCVRITYLTSDIIFPTSETISNNPRSMVKRGICCIMVSRWKKYMNFGHDDLPYTNSALRCPIWKPLVIDFIGRSNNRTTKKGNNDHIITYYSSEW